jgi:hypothetical protein
MGRDTYGNPMSLWMLCRKIVSSVVWLHTTTRDIKNFVVAEF